jgi:hypothetical protein
MRGCLGPFAQPGRESTPSSRWPEP